MKRIIPLLMVLLLVGTTGAFSPQVFKSFGTYIKNITADSFVVNDVNGDSVATLSRNGWRVGGNYTLPIIDGTADYVLKTDGSGVVSWAADGALNYFDEADDNDTSVFTATAPNTSIGFNDQLTMQGNNIIGVSLLIGDGVVAGVAGLTLDDEVGNSPPVTWRDGDDNTFFIQKLDAGPVTLSNGEGSINFLSSGDADDYLSISTASNDITIETIGGTSGDLKIKAAGGDIDFDDENLTTTGTMTVPIVIGGTGTTSDLSLKTTSDAGATGADMHFLVGNDGATEAMTILNNGRVGIGTNSPNGTFEVEGPNAGTVGGFPAGALQVTGTSAAQFTPAVITGHNSYSGNTQLWYLGSMSSANDDVCFMNRQDAELGLYTNNTKRLIITNAGYVGIGDETPIALLTVGDGDVFQVSATGNVVADGNLSVGNAATSAGVLTLLEDDDDGTNFISFMAPTLGGDYAYTLPGDFGTNGYQLTTNGSGTMSWAAAGGGGSGETNTLADTGTFDGVSGFGLTQTKVNSELRIRGLIEGSHISIAISADTGYTITASGSVDTAAAMVTGGIVFATGAAEINSTPVLGEAVLIVGDGVLAPTFIVMSGGATMGSDGVLAIEADAIVPLNLVDSNVAAKGDFVAIAGTGAAFDEFGFYSPAEVLTAIGGLAVEVNDLESDGANGIATTEIFIGNAANAGTYTALSGGATMDNAGAVTIVDDLHNHVYSNIDQTTSANWAGRVSDATGTGAWVFGTTPTFTTGVDINLAATDNITIDARTNNRTVTVGALRLNHTPQGSTPGTRAIYVDVDANSVPGTQGIHVHYEATALAAGETGIGIDVEGVTSSSTGGDIQALHVSKSGVGLAEVHAIHASAGVHVIDQLSGSFSSPTEAWKRDTSLTAWADLTSPDAVGSSAIDSTLFDEVDDYLYIGNTVTFSEIDFVFNTFAGGSGISPTFEFSIAGPAWTVFTPIDNTDGMRQDGGIEWAVADLTSWASVTVNGGAAYYIRILRNQGGGSTDPVEDRIRISVTTEYQWNKDGDLSVNDIALTGTVDGVDLSALDADVAADSAGWNKQVDDEDHFYLFNMGSADDRYQADAEWSIDPRTKAAITITRIDVTLDADPTTELVFSLKFADAFIGLANATTIDVLTTTAGVTTITSGFDDATVPANKVIYISIDADPDDAITQVSVKVSFTID